MELSSRLHQLPKLGMRGALPPRPYLEFPGAMLLLLLLTALPVQGRLTADGHEVAFGLPHGDQSLLACRHVVLPDGVVARQVPRVDAGEVGRLQPASLAVAVREQPRTVRPRHQVAEVVLRTRRGGRCWGTYWRCQGNWCAQVQIGHGVKSPCRNKNRLISSTEHSCFLRPC